MSARRRVDDLTMLTRAGRAIALQVSAALIAVLLIVGAVAYGVDTRIRERQIAAQLHSLTDNLDGVANPPPGTIVGLELNDGGFEASAHPDVVGRLLTGATGTSTVRLGGDCYRALVVDTSRGRVVALLSMQPYETGRARLLCSLVVGAVVGVGISLLVATALTRRLIRPLTLALEVQRRFVADVSHELRAPLTVLFTRAQVLARRADAEGCEELSVQANALVDDARALNEIIDDLLESAAAAAPDGRSDLVDLSTVVTDVRRSMGSIAESMDVDLGFDRPDQRNTFTVRGSASALRRALVALVDNALAHESPGGIIVLRLSRTPRDVVLSVIDDGTGIDSASAASLFTRFTRGADSKDDDGRRGYGIGLALVREIARAHGGDVRYSETPGGGATFTMRLPAVD